MQINEPADDQREAERGGVAEHVAPLERERGLVPRDEQRPHLARRREALARRT
jgi:hypothetical protein